MSGGDDPTAPGESAPDPRSMLAGEVPYAGFEVSVIVDRAVYAPGDVVRVTVTAVNQDERFVEHHYQAWQRFRLEVLDEYHRPVADSDVARRADDEATDRWLPGQMVIFPLYWTQHEGPIVPAWSSRAVGERVDPGRYRARVSWLGRESGVRAEPPVAFSPFFELR
jgi:hypothetical protein